MAANDYIFICCSTADSVFAERLAGDLKDAGFEQWLDMLWLDTNKISVERSSTRQIDDTIEHASAMVAIVSSSFIQSNRVEFEYKTFLEKALAGKAGKNLVAIIMDSVAARSIPVLFPMCEQVDFRQDYDAALASLTGILRQCLQNASVSSDKQQVPLSCEVGRATVEFLRGDITELKCDGIVIPTNCYLMAVTKDGIDAVVRQAAGPEMAKECNTICRCETGKAVITGGGRLAPRKVIHMVPSSWKGGETGEEKTLESCYQQSLDTAIRNGISTIAFPVSGLSHLKFPLEKAAGTAAGAVCRFLRSHQKQVKVCFVFSDESELQAYARSFQNELRKVTAKSELQKSYDVFISFKSSDLVHARRVYEYLSRHGVKTFFSSESIDDLGDPGYVKVIHAAIDRSTHMVVVTSDAANICEDLNPAAKWVEEERNLYLAEQLAGRKAGNILTLITGDCVAADLPIELRSREVIELSEEGLERLLRYVTMKGGSDASGLLPRSETPKGCIRVSDFFLMERPLENVSWSAAREYAASLVTGGKRRWDLPSRAQLKQIREAGLFKKERYYSRDGTKTGEVYYVHFEDGHAGVTPKDYSGRGIHGIFVTQ